MVLSAAFYARPFGIPLLVQIHALLDTPVCQIQTKQFNTAVAGLGDQINAVTISLDLPFAQGRFCGDENIENVRTVSDYQDRTFGNNWGMLIEEIKLLARGVFVLDADGVVQYAQTVTEVTDEPDYDAAMAVLNGLL